MKELTRKEAVQLANAMNRAAKLSRQHHQASMQAWKILNLLVGFEVDSMAGDEAVEIIEYGGELTTPENAARLVYMFRNDPMQYRR